MVMYDMEELRNESIKDTDLWSRRMSFSPYRSQINAVSNMTKFAVSYRKKLTVFDVWKDRDYEECPDESESPKYLDLPPLVHTDSEGEDEYYNPALMANSDTDSDEDEEENHPHDNMSSPSSIESESDAENMNE